MTDAGALRDSLAAAVADGVPGVVAGLTDREGITFLSAEGVRSTATGELAAADTVISLFSVSKAFTTTAALQCVEEGLIDLDAPAREYVPEIGDLEVLVSLAEDGTLTTRPPRRDITPRMLLLHTAGFGYDIFDPAYARLARARTGNHEPWDELRMPLLHDPGERWTYGIGIDWLGVLVASVRGERLDHVFRDRIYGPCGITSTSFDLSDEMAGRAATVHRRLRTGDIVPGAPPTPARAELDMGGQGLWSTVPDVLALLRVWLGDGSAPGGRVLRAETVEWAANAGTGVVVTPLEPAIPALARRLDLFPELGVSWVPSFLRVDADVPGRRRAGTLSWVGLGNVNYWIDRASGLAGVWAAQLLPLHDPACVSGFEHFEKSAYTLPRG
jgi:methyl acetate hydrolase